MGMPDLKRMVRTALEDPIPTRLSLLSRLKNWGDEDSWKDFFNTYWRLIYAVALKAGLTDAEAQDVVQETIIHVAREIGNFKRDPARGTFKAWLRNITNWRIGDQFRNRRSTSARLNSAEHQAQWQEAAQIPDPSTAFQDFWEQEWRANLWSSAVQRVKSKVEDEHYQIFQLHCLKDRPAREVSQVLRVNIAKVYLVKRRIARLIKAEVIKLEKDGF